MWPREAIAERRKQIEWDDSTEPGKPRGLTWSVIESIPVHESIKQGREDRDSWIGKYKESIRNVGKVGIPVVTYNWMPVVDWTRTNLEMELADGARALQFNRSEYIAFDLFMLKREGAEKEYSSQEIEAARSTFESMNHEQRYVLQKNIIAGLPGGQEGYSIEDFRLRLQEYDGITPDIYRENLRYFLQEIVPVAIESGVRLAIHPDDPPVPLFGLPRVVSTEADLQYIVNTHDSISMDSAFAPGHWAFGQTMTCLASSSDWGIRSISCTCVPPRGIPTVASTRRATCGAMWTCTV